MGKIVFNTLRVKERSITVYLGFCCVCMLSFVVNILFAWYFSWLLGRPFIW